MLEINVKCQDYEDACAFRDYLCNSLVGCPAFIENDIIISNPDKNNTVPMYIGGRYGTIDLKLNTNKKNLDITSYNLGDS